MRMMSISFTLHSYFIFKSIFLLIFEQFWNFKLSPDKMCLFYLISDGPPKSSSDHSFDQSWVVAKTNIKSNWFLLISSTHIQAICEVDPIDKIPIILQFLFELRCITWFVVVLWESEDEEVLFVLGSMKGDILLYLFEDDRVDHLFRELFFLRTLRDISFLGMGMPAFPLRMRPKR